MHTLTHRISLLLKDSLVYGLGGAVGSFVGLFLVPIFTRLFAPAEYGLIDLITAFSSVASLLLIMGLDSAVARYYYDDSDNQPQSLKIFSTGLIFESVVSLILCAILLLLSKNLSAILLKDNRYQLYLMLGVGCVPFMVLRNYYTALLRWKRQKYRYLGLTLTEVLLTPLLSIYLVVFLHQGVKGIFIGRLITYLTIFLMGFTATRKNYSFIFSFPLLKKLLAFGLPYGAIGLSLTLMAASDKYFINFYVSLKDVGLYTVGQRIASIASLAVLGFQAAWGPFAFSIHKEKEAKETYAKILEYYAILTSLMFVFLTTFAKELLLLLSTKEYLGGVKVIAPLTFNLVLNGVYFIVCIGTGISKKTYYSAIAVISGASVSFLLNFLLVPRFGIQGAAYAMMLSNLTSVVLVYNFSQRVYPIDYKIPKVLAVYSLAFLITLISHFTFHFSNYPPVVSILAKLALTCSFIAAVIFSPILNSNERDLILRRKDR